MSIKIKSLDTFNAVNVSGLKLGHANRFTSSIEFILDQGDRPETDIHLPVKN